MSDTIYLRDIRKRPGFLTVWERHRHHKAHWFVELFAESVSPFLSLRNNLLNRIAVAGRLSLLVIFKLLDQSKYHSHVVNLLPKVMQVSLTCRARSGTRDSQYCTRCRFHGSIYYWNPVKPGWPRM